MRFEETRDALVAVLKSVDGMGVVFSHLKLVTDLEAFLRMYTVPSPYVPEKKLPLVAWLTRTSMDERPEFDEAGIPAAAVYATDTWTITLLHGFYDDDDEEAASDTHFQRLLDRIADRMRYWTDADVLDLPGGAIHVHPVSVASAGLFSTEAGGFLCHKAEILIRFDFQFTS